jgi:4-amino-4-deoxy-L-arabinose transferase-like glycosyltransferase
MSHKFLVSSVILVVFLRIATLGLIPLTDPSEGRYAMIAKDMADSQNYVTPQIWIDGKLIPFLGKPPLFFWLASASINVLGTNEFAVRLPVFISAILLLLISYLVMKRYKGTEIALASVFINASSGLFFFIAGAVLLDMTLTLFSCGALLFYYGFIKDEKLKNKKVFSLAVFIFLALGFITKGPVVLAMFGIPVFIWTLLNNQWKGLKNHSWILGMISFLLISIPWFYLAENKNPGFLKYFFLNENFLRYVKHDYGDLYGNGHMFPRGTAIVFMLTASAPWTIIMLWLSVLEIKKNSSLSVSSFRSIKNSFAFLKKQFKGAEFFLCSFMSIVIFWCFARQLLLYYLLPAVPLFGIWAAISLNPNREKLKRIIQFSTSVVIFFSLFTIPISFIVRTNKSTKDVVTLAKKFKEKLNLNGGFVFVERDPYSAHFYAGEFLLPHSHESLQDSFNHLLAGGKENLFIVPKKYLKDITKSQRKLLKELYSSRSWTIFFLDKS